ncbi:MAG: NAD(P)H-hydrate dehydratase [Caulobacteraceae bacterium]
MTPIELTGEVLHGHPLPSLDKASDKYNRGRILVVAGGAEVPGAAVLCGLAALRAGAGVLQLAAAPAWALPLAFAIPEARVVAVAANQAGDVSGQATARILDLAEKVDAVVVGPGMIDEAAAQALAQALIAASGEARLVIDAGALCRAAAANASNPPIFTPHAGEAAKLLGVAREEIDADPIAAATSIAQRHGAVAVLKGPTTHIATPAGELWRHRGGVVGLGTGGSGDVLAGLIGGLAAPIP